MMATSRRRATGTKAKRSTKTGKRGASQEDAVMLTLSSSQVEQVLRAAIVDSEATGAGILTADQLAGARERRYRALLDDRRLSRSLLAGLLVLTCFPPDGGELGIADLARRLDMRTSTIHRYVSTLLAAGLLERDPVTRQYRLAQ
jgi:IclR helix-turn-helix domain